MSKRKFVCSRCGRDKHSAGGLRTHQLYSKRCGFKEMPAAAIQPQVTSASAEKSTSEEQWDPGWSEGEKRRHFLENLPWTWGIAKRGGRFCAVPMVGATMGYNEARVHADKFEFIRRMTPRPSQQEPDTRDDDFFTVLMLLLASR